MAVSGRNRLQEIKGMDRYENSRNKGQVQQHRQEVEETVTGSPGGIYHWPTASKVQKHHLGNNDVIKMRNTITKEKKRCLLWPSQVLPWEHIM